MAGAAEITKDPQPGAPVRDDAGTLAGSAQRDPATVGSEEAAQPDSGRAGVLRSTRIRMLVMYLVLLVLCGALTTIGIRELLFIRLVDRVESALSQEMLEVQRLIEDGTDPVTGRPFDSLTRSFDVFFARNVPSDDEAFVAFVDGGLRSSTLERYPIRSLPDEPMAMWADYSAGGVDSRDTLVGSFETPHGEAQYRAVRLEVGDEVGAFVVTILPSVGLAEIRELQTYGALVTLGVVTLVAAGAWFLAGRVLDPVRDLTETARSISEADRTGRITVRGTGEAAEMADTFNAMLDRLEVAYQSQLQFLRSAGHELRAPLTVATGHLEVIGDDEAERRATITLVLDELGRMGRMVDDLQSLAESVHPDFLALQRFDLRQLVHDVVARAPMLGDRAWQLDQSVGGSLLGDRDRLLEAMLALADNAAKNTQPVDTIGIGAAVTAAEVHLWVRDAGVGVAAEDHKRIFDEFVRGRSAARRYRGSGLGLAIVRTIAEAHGGRVTVDSAPGRGSRFTIVLRRTGVEWRES